MFFFAILLHFTCLSPQLGSSSRPFSYFLTFCPYPAYTRLRFFFFSVVIPGPTSTPVAATLSVIHVSVDKALFIVVPIIFYFCCKYSAFFVVFHATSFLLHLLTQYSRISCSLPSFRAPTYPKLSAVIKRFHSSASHYSPVRMPSSRSYQTS